MCGKRFFSFLVFLALLSPLFSQSPDAMTDAEIIAELMSNLEKRETILKADRESLTKERKDFETEKALFEIRKELLAETEAFWKNYKKDTLRSKVIIGSLSCLGGFLAGNYTGFTLGVSVER